MRDFWIHSLLLLICAAAGYIGGHYDGKRTADEWYAKHQPVATTQQIVTCSGVTLIDPIKVRTTEPVVSVGELR